MSPQKKIGITGASGFIGKQLVKHYLNNNYKVVVLTRDESKFKKHPNLEVFHLDLLNPKKEILKKFLFDLDVLFHLAAELRDVNTIHKINVVAFNEVLNFINTSKTHLIYLSSIGIYDFKSQSDITETSLFNPNNTYEKSKLQAEKLITNKINLKTTVLRPATVIGKSMKSKLLKQLNKRSNSFITINIDPNTIANFILVEDVVHALKLIETNQASKGQQYNLSRDISLKTFFENLKISRKNQIKIPSFVFLSFLKILSFLNIHKSSYIFFTNKTTVNTSKIEKELNFVYQSNYKTFLNEYHK